MDYLCPTHTSGHVATGIGLLTHRPMLGVIDLPPASKRDLYMCIAMASPWGPGDSRLWSFVSITPPPPPPPSPFQTLTHTNKCDFAHLSRTVCNRLGRL